MRFLADESCDFAAVRALRDAGHEVIAVAESARGAPDHRVLELADESRSVLLTEDKDFGRLSFSRPRPTGVVLIRYPSAARADLGRAVVEAVARLGQRVETAFVVLEPGRVRVGGTSGADA